MGPRADRGAVTAEAALVLPLLVAVTAALCWLLAVGAAQVRAVDAAREAARAVARGDDPETARSLARRISPEATSVSVVRSGDEVRVEVSGGVPGPLGAAGLGGAVPDARVGATAVALVEPGVP